jgi:hypothetical protein
MTPNNQQFAQQFFKIYNTVVLKTSRPGQILTFYTIFSSLPVFSWIYLPSSHLWIYLYRGPISYKIGLQRWIPVNPDLNSVWVSQQLSHNRQACNGWCTGGWVYTWEKPRRVCDQSSCALREREREISLNLCVPHYLHAKWVKTRASVADPRFSVPIAIVLPWIEWKTQNSNLNVIVCWTLRERERERMLRSRTWVCNAVSTFALCCNGLKMVKGRLL